MASSDKSVHFSSPLTSFHIFDDGSDLTQKVDDEDSSQPVSVPCDVTLISRRNVGTSIIASDNQDDSCKPKLTRSNQLVLPIDFSSGVGNVFSMTSSICNKPKFNGRDDVNIKGDLVSFNTDIDILVEEALSQSFEQFKDSLEEKNMQFRDNPTSSCDSNTSTETLCSLSEDDNACSFGESGVRDFIENLLGTISVEVEVKLDQMNLSSNADIEKDYQPEINNPRNGRAKVCLNETESAEDVMRKKRQFDYDGAALEGPCLKVTRMIDDIVCSKKEAMDVPDKTSDGLKRKAVGDVTYPLVKSQRLAHAPVTSGMNQTDKINMENKENNEEGYSSKHKQVNRFLSEKSTAGETSQKDQREDFRQKYLALTNEIFPIREEDETDAECTFGREHDFSPNLDVDLFCKGVPGINLVASNTQTLSPSLSDTTERQLISFAKGGGLEIVENKIRKLDPEDTKHSVLNNVHLCKSKEKLGPGFNGSLDHSAFTETHVVEKKMVEIKRQCSEVETLKVNCSPDKRSAMPDHHGFQPETRTDQVVPGCLNDFSSGTVQFLDTDEPYKEQQITLSEPADGKFLSKSMFRWNTRLDVCVQLNDVPPMTNQDCPHLFPLETCKKPIRLGLSRKQKLKSLHRIIRQKPKEE